MFAQLESRTYLLFAGLNLLWAPTVYLLYPETRNRSLESIKTLYSSLSPCNWSMERAFAEYGDVLVEKGG